MDNINEVIDNICTRIGTTAERMVPEYARMKITSSAVLLVLLLVIFAVSIAAVRCAYKRYKEDEYDEARTGALLGAVIFAAVASFVFLIFGVDAILTITKYSAAPYAAFIEEMLKGVGK